MTWQSNAMNMPLNPDVQKRIEDHMRRRGYASADEVVIAALSALEQREEAGDFEPGEMERLLAEGEASGPPLDGETVLAERRSLRVRRPGKTG